MSIEYQRGESLLHRLYARTKLLIFIGVTILAVIIVDPILMGLIFMTLYLLGVNSIDRKLLNRNLRVLVVIFLTFSLFQILFFTPKDAHFLFYLIPFTDLIPVTVEGLIRGVAVFFRFFSVVLAVHLMLYTTPPVNLALTITKREQQRQVSSEILVTFLLGLILFVIALLVSPQIVQRIPLSPSMQWVVVVVACFILGFLIQKLANQGLPPEMGVALTLGFATVGILSIQTQKITDAQKARGYNVQPKNIFRRVQVLTALLLPIFLATLERSQDITIAILSRGFDYNIGARTYRRQLAFHRIDYLVLALIVALILGSLYLNYLGLGNPTEQLILNVLA
jgi:energy-coupling factor transporter transmembrane protein EcfT